MSSISFFDFSTPQTLLSSSIPIQIVPPFALANPHTHFRYSSCQLRLYSTFCDSAFFMASLLQSYSLPHFPSLYNYDFCALDERSSRPCKSNSGTTPGVICGMKSSLYLTIYRNQNSETLSISGFPTHRNASSYLYKIRPGNLLYKLHIESTYSFF